MEGSPGILPHTLRFDFKKIAVVDKNGKRISIGEVELYSRWLGSHNIPVVLVIGDREATYEANCFNPYRQACCVKSLFQPEAVEQPHMLEKLEFNIKSALSLDRELCLSSDSDMVEAIFHNPDIAGALADIGYNKVGNKIIFKSCADFVNGLYTLVGHLQQINKDIFEKNAVFLKELRKLTVLLKKEEVANSEIGPLLSGNLMFLDKVSRNKITDGLKSMAEKQAGALTS
jgi:hypothetical protein